MAQMTRFWCFTVNNPTEADGQHIEEAHDKGQLEYLVIGREVGAEGTPHLQGYLILKKQGRMSAVRKMLPRAHLEQAKGTPEQASDYCKKDCDYREWGVLPVPRHVKGGEAQKRKYKDAWDAAKSGMYDMREL